MKKYNQKPMMSDKTKLYRFIKDSDMNEHLTRKEITFLEGFYGMLCTGNTRFISDKQVKWMISIFNDRKKSIN